MTKFVRFVSMFCLLFVYSMVPQRAGAVTQTGDITTIFVNESGTVFVSTDDPTFLTPCATSGRYAFTIVDSQQGKAFYAMILTATALRRVIEIAGRNTCNLHSNSEDVRFIKMFEQ